MSPIRLDVVVFKEAEWLVAQCLQHNLVAQARTLEDLGYELQLEIVAHALTSFENGDQPFDNLPPAPKRYWDMFAQGRPLTLQDVHFKLPPEIPDSFRVEPDIAEVRFAA